MYCRDHDWERTQIEKITVFGDIVKCVQCKFCKRLGFRRKGYAGIYLERYFEDADWAA